MPGVKLTRAAAAATLLLTLLGAEAGSAEPLPAKLFAAKSQYVGAWISPTGKYLAVATPIGDQTALGVIDLEAMKLVGGLGFTHGEHVAEATWVSPERIVVSIEKSFGPLDQPYSTGELYGMDADGSRKVYLYGYRGADETGSRVKRVTKEGGLATVARALPELPGQVLVAIFQWVDGQWALPTIERMDTLTGTRKKLAGLPLYMPFGMAADRAGVPRLAVGLDAQAHLQLLAPQGADGKLQKLVHPGDGLQEVELLEVSRDGSTLLTAAFSSGRTCLQRYGGEPARFEDLSCSDSGSVGVPIIADGVPIGVRDESGVPSVKLLGGDSPEAALLQRLYKAFPGQRVLIADESDDRGKLVLFVDSDRNPGDYYLFDRKTQKARYLISQRKWIDPEKMSPSEAIEYKSRDGLVIHGYLTAAAGVKTRKAPMVVMPHGGPYGVRDAWEWDAWAQFLASRGYVVLQPNYRGSSGFGVAFEQAGYRKWGTAMQDDLTDGVRWAVAQGIADPARVCIFGASYGGYAALMSAMREPDLYRCAAGFAGVYDLGAQISDSDTQKWIGGPAFFKAVLGEDPLQWAEQSPVTHVAKLKAAVLIAHGTADERVPFSQAKRLRSALEKAGKPFEWLEYGGEEHGFYKDENHEDFLNKLADFLDRHIGAKAESPASKP